jgi:carbon-monoxide dehydrogenase medium subunit
VKPAPFSYADPRSLDEALAVLSEEGEGAKVLAGGQSLLPLLNMRLAAPTTLVDINRVPGLDLIEAGESGVRVGALVRHAALLRSRRARSSRCWPARRRTSRTRPSATAGRRSAPSRTRTPPGR